MSDINQLKHFDALDYKSEYFTNELNLKMLLLNLNKKHLKK